MKQKMEWWLLGVRWRWTWGVACWGESFRFVRWKNCRAVLQQQCECSWHYWTAQIKMVKRVNFIVCIHYHNEKKNLKLQGADVYNCPRDSLVWITKLNGWRRISAEIASGSSNGKWLLKKSVCYSSNYVWVMALFLLKTATSSMNVGFDNTLLLTLGEEVLCEKWGYSWGTRQGLLWVPSLWAAEHLSIACIQPSVSGVPPHLCSASADSSKVDHVVFTVENSWRGRGLMLFQSQLCLCLVIPVL